MFEFTRASLQTEEGQRAFSAWVKEQYQAAGRYAFGQGLVPEDADGRVIWAIPGAILLARVWSRSNDADAYWVITGKDLPTDHIEQRVAESARDAVKHFALKWQLQAARIGTLSSGQRQRDPGAEVLDVDWTDVGTRLAAQAEQLYTIVARDEYWEGQQGSGA